MIRVIRNGWITGGIALPQAGRELQQGLRGRSVIGLAVGVGQFHDLPRELLQFRKLGQFDLLEPITFASAIEHGTESPVGRQA